MLTNELPAISTELTDYTIKVLLVDDQPIVAETVRRMIENEKDIIFHYCQDPTKAISMAAEISPTLILQDLVMPEIDGLTLVKFFRAHSKLKDVPLIVLSSKEEAITKAEAFAVGANDYLVKLPDKIELLARIRYHSRGYINLLQRNDAYQALLKSQQALASELEKAANYVISLLPQPLSSDKISTDWRFVPSEQLGGDSFGYHWIDEEHFAMYLLDVCGHGVGSALLSISALNVLRAQSLPDTDFRQPEQVLSALNQSFQMADHNDMYFTMWYGVYNKRTNELKYGSAGHPPGFLISEATGESHQLMNQNFIIGGLPDFPYTSSSITVVLPAKLFIYSDGVYEIEKTDGVMWEMEEFFNFLKNPPDGEADEMDKLHQFIVKLGGKEILDDDFSMMKVVINDK